MYTEAPGFNVNGWHPVTITTQNWALRDLDAQERVDLLGLLGYRLPMDAGQNEADPHNEWFKAASARRLGDGTVVFDAVYGFGHDTINTGNANFVDSGDPFEPGCTPAGFYNGINTIVSGVTITSDTENAYGLYDMTGNVHQWIQDQFAPSTISDRCALRGESFNDPAGSESLRNMDRPRFATPGLTHARIGFHVVRTLSPTVSSCVVGPGKPLPAGCETFDLDRDGDADLLDFSLLQLDFTP